jgi:hypothetical protein
MMSEPDDVLQRLAELPRPDQEPTRAGELRARALARFTSSDTRSVRAQRRTNARVHWLEPALVAAFAAIYACWTASAIAELRDVRLGRAEHFAQMVHEPR